MNSGLLKTFLNLLWCQQLWGRRLVLHSSQELQALDKGSCQNPHRWGKNNFYSTDRISHCFSQVQGKWEADRVMNHGPPGGGRGKLAGQQTPEQACAFPPVCAHRFCLLKHRAKGQGISVDEKWHYCPELHFFNVWHALWRCILEC